MTADIRPLAKAGVHERFLQFFLEVVDPQQPKMVLDVGTGRGAFAQTLQRAGFSVQACDLHPEKFLCDGIACKQADITQHLPYADNTFDALVAIEVVEHLPDHTRFFRECRRVLKPHGKMLLSTPNILSFKSRLSFLCFGFFDSFKPLNVHRAFGAQHVAALTFDQYCYLAHLSHLTCCAVTVDQYQVTSRFFLWLRPLTCLSKKGRRADFRANNQIQLLLGRKVFIAFQALEPRGEG